MQLLRFTLLRQQTCHRYRNSCCNIALSQVISRGLSKSIMKTLKFIAWAIIGAVFVTLFVALLWFTLSLRTANDIAGAAAMIAIWQLCGLLVTLLCAVAGFFLARMLSHRPKATAK
jgi:branched-subunit amino acid transport protein